MPRRTVDADQLGEHLSHAPRADAAGHVNRQALPGPLVDVAAGIGLTGEGTGLLVGTVAALFGWVIWAALIYVLGAKVFPQPQTQVDIGELLRTTGFAAGPPLTRRDRSPTLTPIRANQIRDVPTRNWPARNATTLVHQPPRHSRDAVQSLRTVPRAFPSRPAE